MTDISGTLRLRKAPSGLRQAVVINSEAFSREYNIPVDWDLLVEEDDPVREGQPLAKALEGNDTLLAESEGIAHIEGHTLYVRYERTQEEVYDLPPTARLVPQAVDGAHVTAGMQLTEGAKNPHKILHVQGADECALYLPVSYTHLTLPTNREV